MPGEGEADKTIFASEDCRESCCLTNQRAPCGQKWVTWQAPIFDQLTPQAPALSRAT